MRLEQLQTAWAVRYHRMPMRRSSGMLDRLELVLAQLVELERQRDAVMEDEARRAERMIQHLARLRGIGMQSATLLVREASCASSRMARPSAPTPGWLPPYSSGGSQREQGSVRPETGVFVPRQLNSHGSGCAISPTARWCDGSTDAWARANGGFARF